MLTPAKYWRVPCDLDSAEIPPAKEFTLPDSLARQKSPPAKGHGITIAAYDETEQTGMLTWIGIIIGGTGTIRTIEWMPTTAQIWVDTPTGRGIWKAGAFGFAKPKIADYGLHELWQEQFGEIELREHVPVEKRPTKAQTNRSRTASERLNPIEVIGEPTNGARAGVVYVLKSAYGYKVGRTRNVPARMRCISSDLI